jgi:hypothetical protein
MRKTTCGQRIAEGQRSKPRKYPSRRRSTFLRMAEASEGAARVPGACLWGVFPKAAHVIRIDRVLDRVFDRSVQHVVLVIAPVMLRSKAQSRHSSAACMHTAQNSAPKADTLVH